MSDIFGFFKPTGVDKRLAPYDLRPDLVAAACQMASDARSDRWIIRLQDELTGSETVLRLMDARYERAMGLLVLTSERLLFRPNKRGTAFDVPLAELVTIESVTRRLTGTVFVTTPDGRLTVDQILGTQGEQLADETRAAIRGLLGG